MKRSFALIMVLASLFILSIVFIMLNDTLATTQRMTQMFVIYPEVQEAWNMGRVWCNYVLVTDIQNITKSDTLIDANTGIRNDDIVMPGLDKVTIKANQPYTATRINFATGFVYASVYKTIATELEKQPYIEEYECHVNYFPQQDSKLDYAATINFIRYLNVDPLGTYITVLETTFNNIGAKYIYFKQAPGSDEYKRHFNLDDGVKIGYFWDSMPDMTKLHEHSINLQIILNTKAAAAKVPADTLWEKILR